MHRVLRYHQKSVQNWTSKPNHQNLTYFGLYLRTWCIFFKTNFFHWNRESRLVNLNTMNPIIRTIFNSLLKGSELFVGHFLIEKWPKFESRSLFSIYIHKFSNYGEYQLRLSDYTVRYHQALGYTNIIDQN